MSLFMSLPDLSHWTGVYGRISPWKILLHAWQFAKEHLGNLQLNDKMFYGLMKHKLCCLRKILSTVFMEHKGHVLPKNPPNSGVCWRSIMIHVFLAVSSLDHSPLSRGKWIMSAELSTSWSSVKFRYCMTKGINLASDKENPLFGGPVRAQSLTHRGITEASRSHKTNVHWSGFILP